MNIFLAFTRKKGLYKKKKKVIFYFSIKLNILKKAMHASTTSMTKMSIFTMKVKAKTLTKSKMYRHYVDDNIIFSLKLKTKKKKKNRYSQNTFQ